MTRYEVVELAAGLRIRSERGIDLRSRLFAAVFAGIFAVFVTERVFGGALSVASSVVAACAVFFYFKTESVRLCVTNVELFSKGDFGRRMRRQKTLCTAEIRRLEFRDDPKTFSEIYGGLYAVTDRGVACMLPFLDFQQTQEIIKAIEEKFPALAKEWNPAEPFGKKEEENPGILDWLRGLL